MVNPILHIGTHKTASTYLQRYYFPAIRNVRFFQGDHLLSDLINSECSLDEQMLLSYEGFSGIAWNQLWKEGKKNPFHWISSFENRMQTLHRLFPNAAIVVFFRPHGELLISMYKQYIQEGGILKMADFYAQDGVIRNEDLSYTKRIEVANALFKKVHILSYRDFQKHGDQYLDIFFQEEFGLKRNHVSQNKMRSNKSISGNKIALLRETNKIYNRFPNAIRKALHITGLSPRQILQTKLSFWSPSDPAYFEDIRTSVNRAMENDWKNVEALKWMCNAI